MTGSPLSSNMEDYLEAIFYLQNLDDVVRVRGIAKHMNVKMPSVSDAIKVLQKKKLVRHKPYSHVELTEKGELLANALLTRHQQLTHFFHEVVGVDTKTAEADACRIEHVVSQQTMQKLLVLIETIDTCDKTCCYISKSRVKQPVKTLYPKIHRHESPGLHSLKKGQIGHVVKVAQHKTKRRKLLDQGFTRGTEVEIHRRTAKDKLEIKVKGYVISLDKKDAELVKVDIA